VVDDHIGVWRLQMLASGDTRLDQDIDRAAGHDQMLHIVAADENKLATAVDRGGLDHAEPAVAAAAEGAAGTSGHDEGLERPRGERDQCDHEQEGRDGEDDAVGVGHGWHGCGSRWPRGSFAPALRRGS
jgi:hypothetical protein